MKRSVTKRGSTLLAELVAIVITLSKKKKKKKKKKKNVCFRVPDPTYVFGPTLNILLFKKKKKKKKKIYIYIYINKNALVTKLMARFCPCRPFLFQYIM